MNNIELAETRAVERIFGSLAIGMLLGREPGDNEPKYEGEEIYLGAETECRKR